jgi:hypothetical protein
MAKPKRINDKVQKSVDSALALLQKGLRAGNHFSPRDMSTVLAAVYAKTRDPKVASLQGKLGELVLDMDANGRPTGIAFDKLVRDVKDEIVNSVKTGKYTSYKAQILKDQLLLLKEILDEYNHIDFSVLEQNVIDLALVAQAIMTLAQDKCPVRELPNGSKPGTLINSATYNVDETGFTVGFYTPYAFYAHENIAGKRTAHHPIHHYKYYGHTYYSYDCGGDGKFLELAVQEVFPNRTIAVSWAAGGGVEWRYNKSWGWI